MTRVSANVLCSDTRAMTSTFKGWRGLDVYFAPIKMA